MTTVVDEDVDLDLDFLLAEPVDEDAEEDEIQAQRLAAIETVFTESDSEFIADLVDKCWRFTVAFSDVEMYDYQEEFGRRIIESLLINDGEEITALFARQSGKTETAANVIAAMMVLLPRLAKLFPDPIHGIDLRKFRKGLMVGTFAPVESMAETLFGRIVSRLTADHATEILLDPEIDDEVKAGNRILRLKKCGSFVRMQTCNPRAKIESKTYHLMVIDEAQDADEHVITKSIGPMGASTNATRVMTGTPTTRKGYFYRIIQLNKNRQLAKRGARKNHFEFDWKHVARCNPDYKKYIRREVLRIGEDSDEFRLSYKIEWLLDRGMFVTASVMESLGDLSMDIVKSWHRSPLVAGLDPAKKTDSTVLTVCWVDWDNPDPFGYFDHRVLNWLELHGDDWEPQYFQICDFLANYSVMALAVDGQGVGDAVAERLGLLLPHIDVQAIPSTIPAQSERWKHLTQLIQREMVGWPAHAKARRLRKWKRFNQQMVDLEKEFKGPHLLAAAPNVAEAHDDYPDSLALACVLTKDYIAPEVEMANSPFFG